MAGHSAERLKCETCGRTYCPKCDSDCPSCCIHRECQTQLREAQEERDEAIGTSLEAERDTKEKGALLTEHHRDSTGMWKCCPICGVSLTPAEEEAPRMTPEIKKHVVIREYKGVVQYNGIKQG